MHKTISSHAVVFNIDNKTFLQEEKFGKVRRSRNVSFKRNKKDIACFYTKRFVFSPLNNSLEVAWHKSFREKLFQCILALMLSSSSYTFVTHFLRKFVFSWHTLPGKSSPEKSDHANWQKLYSVLFLPWNLCAKFASLESTRTYWDSSPE